MNEVHVVLYVMEGEDDQDEARQMQAFTTRGEAERFATIVRRTKPESDALGEWTADVETLALRNAAKEVPW